MYVEFNSDSTYYLTIQNKYRFKFCYEEFINIEDDTIGCNNLSKKEIIQIVYRLQPMIEKFRRLDEDVNDALTYNTKTTFTTVSKALNELVTLLSNFSDDHKF